MNRQDLGECLRSANLRFHHRNVTYRDLQEKLEAVQLASCDGASASMEENTLKERSMYCKELLTQGKTEFCFEELRAERYTLARRQEVYGNPPLSAYWSALTTDWWKHLKSQWTTNPYLFLKHVNKSHMILNIVINSIVSL